MRFVASSAAALVCAFAIAGHAQETTTEKVKPESTTEESKTKTKVKGDKADIVKMTGCLQEARSAEAQSYILSRVVPLGSRTSEVTGTSGTISRTSTTTYA